MVLVLPILLSTVARIQNYNSRNVAASPYDARIRSTSRVKRIAATTTASSLFTLLLCIILFGMLDDVNIVNGWTSFPRRHSHRQHDPQKVPLHQWGIMNFKISNLPSSPFLFLSRQRKYQNKYIVALPSVDKSQPDGGESTNESDNDIYDHDEYIVMIGTKIPTQDSPTWEMYNDFPQFINQCTVQSFVFLLRTCHDIHTVQYIENFTQPMIDPIVQSRQARTNTNSGPLLLNYHGINAMNVTAFPTWDNYFEQLLRQPKQIFIIESYQKHIPTYEMDINPVSLCQRMMSVREQIAKEMAHDLYIIAQMKTAITSATTTMTDSSSGSSNSHTNTAHGPSRYQLAMDDVLFLDTWDANDGDYIMPSPLRKGNFDLLLLYLTQESIHRILNHNTYSLEGNEIEYDEDDGDDDIALSQAEEQLLSHFYLHRLVSHFTGRQRYGRANEFLQELLAASDVPPASDDNKNSSGAVVSTARIVEHIIRTRQRVASEYSQYAANVPNLHIPIKKIQLNLLMQSYNTNNNSPPTQAAPTSQQYQ